MQPIVHDVLRSPGQPLDGATRAFMEPRFGHDFSQVRVHADTTAAASARAVNALAYTVGPDVVFDVAEYAPRTTAGRRLLAHELTHVVQQGTRPSALRIDYADSEAEHRADIAAEQVMSGRDALDVGSARPGALQCQEVDEEERRRASMQLPEFRLQEPVLGQSLGLRRPGLGLELPSLQLDPEIAAQIRAIQFMHGLITPDNVMQAVRGLGSLPGFMPTAAQASPSLTGPTVAQPGPLVPRGAGPSTPRAATAGDLLEAVTGIPIVKGAITRLGDEAENRLRSDWARLSGGERALVITQGVLIAGGALAGVLANAEARRLALDQVQGQTIPIPGLPVTFQFNMTGPDQRLVIGLNVGALLPKSLGFK